MENWGRGGSVEVIFCKRNQNGKMFRVARFSGKLCGKVCG